MHVFVGNFFDSIYKLNHIGVRLRKCPSQASIEILKRVVGSVDE